MAGNFWLFRPRTWKRLCCITSWSSQMSEQDWCIIQHSVYCRLMEQRMSEAELFCSDMFLFKDENFCSFGLKTSFSCLCWIFWLIYVWNSFSDNPQSDRSSLMLLLGFLSWLYPDYLSSGSSSRSSRPCECEYFMVNIKQWWGFSERFISTISFGLRWNLRPHKDRTTVTLLIQWSSFIYFKRRQKTNWSTSFYQTYLTAALSLLNVHHKLFNSLSPCDSWPTDHQL